MAIFDAMDVLLPRQGVTEAWPVIACDQFTSEPEYWERLREQIAERTSTLDLIFPEVMLEVVDKKEKIASINAAMEKLLNENFFSLHENAFLYVERELKNGSLRRGLVGKVDLACYDFNEKTIAAIRATEKTVPERIPPRVAIRRDASLELSHVLMLADDEKDVILGTAKTLTEGKTPIYDLDLLGDGGALCGWLIQGREAQTLQDAIDAYEKSKQGRMVYAVGDGNHSLATAKTIYEEKRINGQDVTLARYAMVELENIHDTSLVFEPIHRVVTNADVEKLFEALKRIETQGEKLASLAVDFVSKEKKGTLYLDPAQGILAIQTLQDFLDTHKKETSFSIDYIHGKESLNQLASRENAVGFLLPAIAKDDFFRGIETKGVLPRKTFSMGHATEKRYYLEARRIKK